MKKRTIEKLGGIFLMLVSIWAGSYFVAAYYNTWAGFPSFATAFGGFTTGAILLAGKIHA